MPSILYTLPLPLLALILFLAIESVALSGLVFTRRRVNPHLLFGDGINDAVSGTVQAIGVFYGITVGLIAVGVWTNYTNGADRASSEAAAIGAFYRDAGMLSEPARTTLQNHLRDYNKTVIEVIWPAQARGEILQDDTRIINQMDDVLRVFKPSDEGEAIRYAETLNSFNDLVHTRRLRIDAVGSGLSNVMWAVIWIGAAISIGVAYFFEIKDVRIHMIMVGLMAGFLSLVLFMIVINDRPFFGYAAIRPHSYQILQDTLLSEASR